MLSKRDMPSMFDLKVFAVAFSLVFLGSSLFLYWKSNSDITVEHLVTSTKLTQTHAFVYGIVESIDPSQRRIVVVRPNPYNPSLPPQRLSFKIDARTAIFKEALIFGPDNIYVAMSARTPATFADLAPKTPVEILPIYLPNSPNDIVAFSVVFGNPL